MLKRKEFLGVLVVLLLLYALYMWQRPPGFTTIAKAEGDVLFVSDRYPDEFGVLYLLNLDTEKSFPIYKYNLRLPPALSPDGTTLALVEVIVSGLGLDEDDENYGTLGIILLNEQGVKTLFGPCRRSPSWSTDGMWLAFHNTCQRGKISLNIARFDGSSERRVVPQLTYVDDRVHLPRISWSPDNQYLVYDDQGASGEWRIWRVAVDGTAPILVTTGHAPAWSPVGNEIAFVRDGDIWLISEDGNEHKFLDDPIEALWPTWSPEGDQMVFTSRRDGNTEIYIVNLDGTGLRNLTNNPHSDLFPTW